MSEPENFLERWSKRKLANADPAAPEQKEIPPQTEKAFDPAVPVASGDASNAPAAKTEDKPFDLASLPSIESIGANTDVTAFLRPGVPADLARAALRRAWSSDPAIRDFVGLAENGWDFNDPNAMAGFGPLDYSAEEVDALVRRIVGGRVEESAESLTNHPAEAAEDAGRPAHEEVGLAQSPSPVKVITDPRPHDESAVEDLPSGPAASQPVAASEAPPPRRTHGGALPR